MSCSQMFFQHPSIEPVGETGPDHGPANRRGGLLALAVAVLLGGCSADITRFDSPSFSLSENGSGAGNAPLPARPIGGMGGRGLDVEPAPAPPSASAYVPPRAQRSSDVKVSALPEPAPHGGASTVGAGPVAVSAPSVSEPRRPTAVPVRDVPTPPVVAAKGEMIEVQQGDTLFGLSKRHKVSITELMTVNDLKSPNLKPGQKLHLPVGKRAAGSGPQKPLARPETVAIKPVIKPAGSPAAGKPQPTAVTNWQGSYTIKSGDSLYAIARQHNVQFAELQSVNGISDPRKVRPGTVIKVPASGNDHVTAPAAASGVAAAARQEAPRVVGGQQPTILNAPVAEQRVAAAEPVSVSDVSADQPASSAGDKAQVKREQIAAAPSAAASSGSAAIPAGKLRWPVKGKVLANFGPRTDGTHNDGVNLSVPLGTDVLAAEAGVVAYAGSELKGYGNLILIRHDNGWVTAYAHNDQLLVKRGDKIKRGQVVAKAGKTGTVDQPQVHFELRQGSKPIDPMPHMEKL